MLAAGADTVPAVERAFDIRILIFLYLINLSGLLDLMTTMINNSNSILDRR